MPHGHCYLWKPPLVGVHVISDGLIGAAYLMIAVALVGLVKRARLPFSPIVISFGIFIGACGATHWMEVWNLWNADYWLAGIVKVITAVASVTTGVWLLRVNPQILAFSESAKQADQRRVDLESLANDLEIRIQERTSSLTQATQQLELKVTERTDELTRVNQALRQRDREFSDAQRIGGLGTFSWRPNEDLFQCSPAFLDLIGIISSQFTGSFSDLLARVHPVDQDDFTATLKNTWVHETESSAEIRFQRPDWTIRTVSVRCAIGYGTEGLKQSVIGIIQDISSSSDTKENPDKLIPNPKD